MIIEEKRRACYLPYEVMAEHILPRLPVKSLLRFKAVCKQWSATISDPTFADAHLQQSKTSFSSFFHPSNHLTRVVLENQEFRELSRLEFPLPLRNKAILQCYCDGLFLFSFDNDHEKYIVWNPSRRAYKELRYPDFTSLPIIGICYDESEMDYKVVIVEVSHYAVFSCKTNSWSKVRTSAVSVYCSSYNHRAGVAYEGSVYWIMSRNGHPDIEILCFDGKDEKLKILHNLESFADHEHRLFTSQNGLFLLSRTRTSTEWFEVVIKQILPVWMEHKLQLPFRFMRLLGFTHQNKLILQGLSDHRICLLYDCSGRCMEDTIIQARRYYSRLHPYIENLFLLQ